MFENETEPFLNRRQNLYEKNNCLFNARLVLTGAAPIIFRKKTMKIVQFILWILLQAFIII